MTKRNGSKEPFNHAKLRKWVTYVIRNSEDQVEKEYELLSKVIPRLVDGVSTTDINDTIIQVCLDKEQVEWSRIAAEVERANIYKTQSNTLGIMHPEAIDFYDFMEIMSDLGYWKHWVDDVALFEKRELINEWYTELEALDLEFPTVKQFIDKYAIKENEEAIETPAQAVLSIAISLHGVTDLAYRTAKAVMLSKLNLPTPVNTGCRDGNFDTISCSVIEANDTVDSLEVAEHLASKMTSKKAGIGITLNTRSKGDPVKEGRIAHLGKAPLYKSIEASVKKFTQLARGGSATMTLKCIDPDIESMLLWKTQRIDLSQRIDKIDYSFAYNDDFVRAVINNDDWYLFSIEEAPEVHEAFHREDYMDFVQDALLDGKKHVKVKALKVLIAFIQARWETGRVYCINLSRANEHTPFMDIITQSNLCVAPETTVLTDVGHIPIAELENQKVNVWNGSEYSEVTVRKTGSNQKLITVDTDSGFSLDCTEYHKFYKPVGYSGKVEEVRAKDLVPGDKLIKLDTPLITGGVELDLAYENGYFSADGCVTKNGDRLYFYGKKKYTVYPFINKEFAYGESENESCDRIQLYLKNLQDKFFVPSNNYSVTSRLQWLAGYMDGDGCIYRNGENEQLVGSSVEKEFLLDVQRMLQTLGIQAKVTEVKGSKGVKKLPKNDGTGEHGEYNCKQLYRIIITSTGLFKLKQLGFKTNRIVWEGKKPQREASRFIKVTAVKDTGRVDDTFCFNEPKKHLGVFNGILTGQCLEIALPTKGFVDMHDIYRNYISEGEIAYCSLAALNVAKISNEEYFEMADIALRTVEAMMVKASECALTDSVKHNLLRRRSVGIGVTGLASRLYQEGLDYDGSKESLDFVESLAELHYYSLLKASQDMVEDGTCPPVEGVDLNWLPIDTMHGYRFPTMDWEIRRGKPRGHSVLVALMPTESSSVFSNATNGIYPSRQRVIYKSARRGKVQFISEHFIEGTHLKAWDVDMIPYYQAFQNYTDQAISCDYYTDFTKYDNKKIPLIETINWFVRQALAGIKTAYYQNFIDTESEEVIEQEETCDSGACKL